MKSGALIAAAVLLAVSSAPLPAQQREGREPVELESGGLRTLQVAKWSTLVASAATAVYGLSMNEKADDRFAALERTCAQQPAACRERLPSGAYADPQLEASYQDVLRLDRRVRASLIVGQLGLAATVVLFILDLRESTSPPNIPYDPDRFRITPSRDGGVQLRLSVPSGL